MTARRLTINKKRTIKSKGAATRTSVLDAFHDTVKTKGYYGTSITEVTQKCGISISAFYQYFENKEQAVEELMRLIVSRFNEKIEALATDDGNLESQIRQLVELLFNHIHDNFGFHRILGESELIDQVTVDYYDAIANKIRLYIEPEYTAGSIRAINTDVIIYGMLGYCYFNSRDWDQEGEDIIQHDEKISLITELVLNGINGELPWTLPAAEALFEIPEAAPMLDEERTVKTKGEKTRQSILEAASGVFSESGVNRAGISEIARKAGIALGTFYFHFKSKKALIEGFLRNTNHELRCAIQRVAIQEYDRREVERVSGIVFFDFVRKHKELFKILPEYEVVEQELFYWYYNKFFQGYIKGLKQGIQRREIRNYPPMFLACSLLGLYHFIGLKWIIFNPSSDLSFPPEQFTDFFRFLYFGIEGHTAEP